MKKENTVLLLVIMLDQIKDRLDVIETSAITEKITNLSYELKDSHLNCFTAKSNEKQFYLKLVEAILSLRLVKISKINRTTNRNHKISLNIPKLENFACIFCSSSIEDKNKIKKIDIENFFDNNSSFFKLNINKLNFLNISLKLKSVNHLSCVRCLVLYTNLYRQVYIKNFSTHVGIFWDIENCHIRSNSPKNAVKKVFENIKSIVYEKLFVVNSFKMMTSIHRGANDHFSELADEFSAIGGEIKHYRFKVKNAADVKIIEAVEDFLSENINLNPYIIIISGDSIFKNFASKFKNNFIIDIINNKEFGKLQKLSFC